MATRTRARHEQWIRGPILDSLVAWAWIPFFGAAALLPDRAGVILPGAFVPTPAAPAS